jgi:hypothetical protein
MSAVRSDGRRDVASSRRPKRRDSTQARRRVSRPVDGTKEAREQFARTFADVLSGRFGGRWSVEWEGADRAALSTDRDGRSLTGEE